MSPSLVFYSGSELLEGPVFDKENTLLYFVSILDGLVYCFQPETKEMVSVRLDSPVGCIFILDKKRVLAASKNGFFEIDFITLKKEFIFQIDIDNNVRYNDGIKDKKGRLLVGTMGFPKVIENIGKVFSCHEGNCKTIIRNTTISNGLAFSLDNKFLYFIDTPTKKVARYFYNLDDGQAVFDSHIIDFKGSKSPDGMSIDNDGMLWIAEWGGGCVSQWNPLSGKLLQKIKLPCINVTSCCFDDNANLYVTTAKENSKEDIYGGGLFYVELNKN
jgi:sugar lactone lactonase YvrE